MGMRKRDRPMPHSRLRRGAVLALATALAVPHPSLAAPAVPSDEATIVHVLNRLAYGPRPGDVEKVQAMGLSKWIERQLEPARIDDPRVGPKLAGLETASLSPRRLLEGYELPMEAKREIQQRRAEMGEDASEEDMRRARRDFVQKYASQMEGAPRQVTAELQE